MAGLFRILRFEGPPPASPDDPDIWPQLDSEGLPEPAPRPSARPFGPAEEIRAVFDRHVPGIRWNERGNGFVKRDGFEMQIVMPMHAWDDISLSIDDYETAVGYLRAIEAERPDWHVTWFDGQWLRRPLGQKG